MSPCKMRVQIFSWKIPATKWTIIFKEILLKYYNLLVLMLNSFHFGNFCLESTTFLITDSIENKSKICCVLLKLYYLELKLIIKFWIDGNCKKKPHESFYFNTSSFYFIIWCSWILKLSSPTFYRFLFLLHFYC